jgi:hypothetical protein
MTHTIFNPAQIRAKRVGHPAQKHDPQFDPLMTRTISRPENVWVICGSFAGHLRVMMTRINLTLKLFLNVSDLYNVLILKVW